MGYSALEPHEVAPRMTGEVIPSPGQPGRYESYLPSPCVQNHAANLAFLPDGALSCVWFGGTMEGMGDISVYMSLLEPGQRRWSDPRKKSHDPTKSEQNPLIFTAPDGHVWLLFTSQTSGNQDGAVVKRRISTDGGKSFGPTDVLCAVPGTFVRQPIIVNGAGDWLLPVFRCIGQTGRRWTGDADRAAVLISRDEGRSWVMEEVPESIGAVHMNIVGSDGDAMVSFYRNRFATNVLRSRSDDGGLHWSPPEPIELPNNNSSIQAIRLKSGVIAMVYNHSNASMSDARRQSLYDEIESEGAADETIAASNCAASARPAGWGGPRAPRRLAFSMDGGRPFPRRIDLDTGDGYCLSNNSKDSLNREFSYPSIVEDEEGRLHIAYTYFRRTIKYVCLEPGFLERIA